MLISSLQSPSFEQLCDELRVGAIWQSTTTGQNLVVVGESRLAKRPTVRYVYLAEAHNPDAVEYQELESSFLDNRRPCMASALYLA